DADEVTYGLHIILRFEIEQELLAGTLAIRDLPEVWNARVHDYLGVDVPDDAHGVLQDMHWAIGLVGYFPTYQLGNVMSVQIWRPDHAAALNAEGLQVSGRHEFVARVTAAVSAAALPEPELVIVATKTTGLEDAAAAIEGQWPAAMVMTVQNGLGAEEVVRRHGGWQLVSGVTFMSGTKHSDTHVEYILDTPTWLGPWDSTPPAEVEKIASVLVQSGLKAEALPDLRPAQWSKLIFNATVNAVAALTGLPHDWHFAAEDGRSELGHLVHDLVDEG